MISRPAPPPPPRPIYVGRDSVVGIATRYGPDGPRSNPDGGRDCPHVSRPNLGPNQPHTQWVPGLSRGYSGRGVALTTLPHLAPRLKKRVDLRVYLYSPLWTFVACSRVNFTFTFTFTFTPHNIFKASKGTNSIYSHNKNVQG
jgi:hypothetical protein